MDFEQEVHASAEPQTKQPIQDTTSFGVAGQFKGDQLPTYGDVLRNIFFLYNEELKQTRRSAALKSFVTIVGGEITKIWERTRIPIYQRRSVENKVTRAVDKYQHFNKHKRSNATEFQKYVASLAALFDIAHCKCDIQNSRCKCSDKQHQIPDSDVEFIIDQRTGRKLNLDLRHQSVEGVASRKRNR